MTEKPASPTSPSAKGDDRNLVPVEAAPAASLEDRVYLLWKKNRNAVIGVIVVAILAVGGWEVTKLVQARRDAAVRDAYAGAGTIEAKRAFARDHADHPLAGLALLAIADDSFANRRFEDAAREYASAAAKLEQPLLRGRARIGEGVAALKAGQSAQGEKALLAVADDAAALMSFRCQALYELAAAAETEGNKAKAVEMIDRLRGLDPEGPWANRASTMRLRVSEDAAFSPMDLGTPPADGVDTPSDAPAAPQP